MAASALASRPRGGYTCARADASGQILGQDVHLRRLLDSFETLFPSAGTQKHVLREKLTDIVQQHLEEKLAENTMLVLLAYLDQDSKDLVVERLIFPVTFTRTVLARVVVGGGGPRVHPVVKDTAWITQRRPLEDLKKTYSADELVLVSGRSPCDWILLEGLVTNFFVVTKDEKVFTAPGSLVLPGAMRQLVLEACKMEGIVVIEEAPRWEARGSWKAAFLTSVAKPCNFIEQLIPYSDLGTREDLVLFDLSDPIVARLSASVDAFL